MISTQIFKYRGSRKLADQLNMESARHYNSVLLNHWRTYRNKNLWLSEKSAYRWEDYQSGGTILHAHSRDAAQQAFYKAIKTARKLRKAGSPNARFPHHRRRYRTTYWKNTGIRKKGDALHLALARGNAPVIVTLPERFRGFPGDAFKEARLVYNQSSRHYEWHIVIDDGLDAPKAPGDNVVSVDLGEIHPAVAGDGKDAVVFSCRELRATIQYGHKRRAELASLRDTKKRSSRRRRRIQARMDRFKARQERRQRDILHKVSRAVVDYAVERKAGRIVIGDVRDVGDSKRMHRKSQQKVSSWPHGKLRFYIEYKAEQVGMGTELQDEHYTSQTCPVCGTRTKPRGRIYRCKACGFEGHRDVVGQCNILSVNLYGELARIHPPQPKYRRPFVKNGCVVPRHGACGSDRSLSVREAAGFQS